MITCSTGRLQNQQGGSGEGSACEGAGRVKKGPEQKHIPSAPLGARSSGILLQSHRLKSKENTIPNRRCRATSPPNPWILL